MKEGERKKRERNTLVNRVSERPGVLKPELINMNDLTNERTSEGATRRVDRVKNGEKGSRAELTSTERERTI